MELTALSLNVVEQSALCPLDNRYQDETSQLRFYLTTPALVRARMYVQLCYLNALSKEPNFEALSPLDDDTCHFFQTLVTSFNEETYRRICATEKLIRHDVKAGEYYLQERFRSRKLENLIPYLRFGVTSEDDTNLAYGILIQQALSLVVKPELVGLSTLLVQKSDAWKNHWMLGHTHGQPATPLTIHFRLKTWSERLVPLAWEVYDFQMHGKFGGAVGNLLAHKIACPEVDWNTFRKKFVQSLGLKPIFPTTQINPHQDLAELCHLLSRLATMLIDFCQNMWLYAHDGVLCLKPDPNAVGSSVMPHKVNPQDFETAEGALEMAVTLLNGLADKLPRSRLERHLSDSHLQRWLGTAFGSLVLGMKKIIKNLEVVYVNTAANKERIATHPEIWSEAIQTVMRRYGYANAYEQLKDITRGKIVSATELAAFVATLERVPQEAKYRLFALLEGNLSQLTN